MEQFTYLEARSSKSLSRRTHSHAESIPIPLRYSLQLPNKVLSRILTPDRMNYSSLPAYLFSMLTAAGFALMGYRLKKGTVLWCIGGAILGLCISTICIGLMHAETLPYTPSNFGRKQSIGIVLAVVAIGITGAIIAVANLNRANRPH